MKISSKVVLSALAFSVVIGLQSFNLYQQNQTNISLQMKVDKLEQQLDSASKANTTLLSKVERIENKLEHKPRQLLSMN